LSVDALDTNVKHAWEASTLLVQHVFDAQAVLSFWTKHLAGTTLQPLLLLTLDHDCILVVIYDDVALCSCTSFFSELTLFDSGDFFGWFSFVPLNLRFNVGFITFLGASW
jgi:hypothetical protein